MILLELLKLLSMISREEPGEGELTIPARGQKGKEIQTRNGS